MLKALAIRLLSSFYKPSLVDVEKMDDAVRLEQAAKTQISLTGSAQERHEKTLAWSKPENIALRLDEFERQSEKAIEAGRQLSREIRTAMGMPLEDPPLPDPLPEHLIGQSESTIRAFLRYEKWEYDKEIAQWKQK